MGIDLKIGTILDERYELVQSLGEGGMGSVFRSREIGLDRLVAVKVLQPSLLTDAESRKRFEREGKVLAAVKHENIVELYRFGIWNNQYPYLVMELLDGRTLRGFINNQDMLAAEDIVEIALQLCAGLQAAHDRGITHRDLKPDNIMVASESPYHVKILDFGLSVSANSQTQHLTQTGALIGSVHYMSPEQCLGRKADPRSDIYALGCVMYELLSGRPPFDCDNAIGLIHMHANEPLSPLVPRCKLPANLDTVIYKALAKNPDARHQSMNELRNELLAVQEGKTVSSNSLQVNKQRKLPVKVFYLCLASCFLTALLTLVWMKMQTTTDAVTSEKRIRTLLRPRGLKSQYALFHALPANDNEKVQTALKLVASLKKADDNTMEAVELNHLFRFLCERDIWSFDEKIENVRFLLTRKQIQMQGDARYDAFVLAAEIYESHSDFRSAEQALKAAVEVASAVNIPACISDGSSRLSTLQFVRGEFAKAKNSALFAIEKCPPDSPSVKVKAFGALGLAELASGNTQAARNALDQYRETIILVFEDPHEENFQPDCIRILLTISRVSLPLAVEQATKFANFFTEHPHRPYLVQDINLRKASFLTDLLKPRESIKVLEVLLHELPRESDGEPAELRRSAVLQSARAYAALGQIVKALELIAQVMPSPKAHEEFFLECSFIRLTLVGCSDRASDFEKYLSALDDFEPHHLKEEYVFRQYLSLEDKLVTEKKLDLAEQVFPHYLKRKCINRRVWEDLGTMAVTRCNANPSVLKAARAAVHKMETRMQEYITLELRSVIYVDYAARLEKIGDYKDAEYVYVQLLPHVQSDVQRLDSIRLRLAHLQHTKLKNYDSADALLQMIISSTNTPLLKLQAMQSLGNFLVIENKPDEALKVLSTIAMPPNLKLANDGTTLAYYQTLRGLSKAYRAKHMYEKEQYYKAKADAIEAYLASVQRKLSETKF